MKPDPSHLPESPSVSQSLEINIQQLHASLNREHNEPHDGFEPVPIWMTIFFGGLLFWGGMYLSANSGDYRGDVFDKPVPKPGATAKAEEIPTDEAGLLRVGAKVFENCKACHQATGEGVAGQFPALNKSEWVVGEKASVARLSRILLHGLGGPIQVRGATYNGAMPAWGAQLKDHQIAAVLTYIRNNWDNKAPAIFPKDIAAARTKIGIRVSPWTVVELETLATDYVDPGATAPTTMPAAPAKK